MIGNDVVNLPQSRIESNWQRKGYLEKIFTSEEQQLISTTATPEIMVWLLWSMKEAAYKIYNRQTKIRAYIPQKLVCKITAQNDHFILGQVSCMGSIYYTKTLITESNIHTIAVTRQSDFTNIVEIKNKGIKKDAFGIPHLITDKGNPIQPVSISHHGGFEKVVILTSLQNYTL